ncbi:MAG: pantoate kinase [Halobacteriales archaeon]
MAPDGSVRADVPGHVTVFFAPRRRDDPARTGSVGAGLTLTDGVTVTAAPAEATELRLNGEPAGMAPVERALSAVSTPARVAATTPLDVGAGFGVSGATTLGAVLAANRAAGGDRTENELVRAAHVAEVESDTGLGDVVAQARGGLPMRLAPGAPPYGELDGVPAAARVEYVSFGPLSTSDVITGDVDELAAAGERALADLRERPTLDRLFALGRRFAREAGLYTDRVEAAIEAVRDAGGEATMAMLGETVVALETGLTDAGYDASACETHPTGVRLGPR